LVNRRQAKVRFRYWRQPALRSVHQPLGTYR